MTSFPFLGPNDPPPVSVLNPEATSPVLLLADHASIGFQPHWETWAWIRAIWRGISALTLVLSP